MDVEKQVEYWMTGSAEDLSAAEVLLDGGHLRHCLFLAHLALEKMLKAHVTRRTRDIPPRNHNLVRLAQLAGLKPNDEQEQCLRKFDAFQLEGRYPDSQQVTIDSARARQQLQKAMETMQWLKAQL